METTKKQKEKRAIPAPIVVFMAVILSVIGLISWSTHKSLKNKNHYEYRDLKQQSKLSTGLKARAKEIGLKEINNVSFYSVSDDALDEFNQKIGNTTDRDAFLISSPAHCAKNKNQSNCNLEMFISNSMQGDDRDALLAHEYLHIMFDRYNLADDKKLFEDTKLVYQKTPRLQESLNGYSSESYFTESVSYLCTEAQDNWLTDYVISTCNKYIDRSKMKFLY